VVRDPAVKRHREPLSVRPSPGRGTGVRARTPHRARWEGTPRQSDRRLVIASSMVPGVMANRPSSPPGPPTGMRWGSRPALEASGTPRSSVRDLVASPPDALPIATRGECDHGSGEGQSGRYEGRGFAHDSLMLASLAGRIAMRGTGHSGDTSIVRSGAPLRSALASLGWQARRSPG